MNPVRFGIAGIGNMGSIHARSLLRGNIPRATLTAVADPVADLCPFPKSIPVQDEFGNSFNVHPSYPQK